MAANQFVNHMTVEPGGYVASFSTAPIGEGDLPVIPQNTVLGSILTGFNAPVALTQAQFTAILNLFTALLQGLVPASGGGAQNFLCADGTWKAVLQSLGLFTAIKAGLVPASGGGINNFLCADGSWRPVPNSPLAFPMPPAPSVLTAGSLAASSVVLTYTIDAKADGIAVWYRVTGTGPDNWKAFYIGPAGGTLSVTGLIPNTGYDFVLAAWNGQGQNGPWMAVTASTNSGVVIGTAYPWDVVQAATRPRRTRIDPGWIDYSCILPYSGIPTFRFVQKVDTGIWGATGVITLNVVAGDLLICVVSSLNNFGTIIGDSQQNAWNRIQSTTPTGLGYLSVFYSIASASGSLEVVINDDDFWASIYEYAPSSPGSIVVDTSGSISNASASTTLIGPTLNPSTGTFYFATFGITDGNNPGPSTAGAGFTLRSSNVDAIVTEDNISVAGSTTPTVSTSTAFGYGAIGAIFKVAVFTNPTFGWPVIHASPKPANTKADPGCVDYILFAPPLPIPPGRGVLESVPGERPRSTQAAPGIVDSPLFFPPPPPPPKRGFEHIEASVRPLRTQAPAGHIDWPLNKPPPPPAPNGWQFIAAADRPKNTRAEQGLIDSPLFVRPTTPFISQHNTNSGTGNTVFATWSVTTGSGSFLIAQVNTVGATPTITTPSGWTLAYQINNSLSNITTFIIPSAAAHSGILSVATSNVSAWQIDLFECGNLSLNDQEANSSGSGSSISVGPTSTTLVANELWMANFNDQGQTYTGQSAGWIIAAQSNPTAGAAFACCTKFVSATGAASCSITDSLNSGNWFATIVTFK